MNKHYQALTGYPPFRWQRRNWALTRLPELSPTVDRYLHGLIPEPPDIYVAWRKEVTYLLDASPETITEWLDTHPILTREQVRGSLINVVGELRKIARREEHAILIPQNDEEVQVIELSDFSEEQGLQDRYRNALILLRPAAGGLNRQGMLDGNVEDAVEDVADEPIPPDFEHRRLRVLIERNGDDWTYQSLATDTESVSISARNLYRALQQIRPQFTGTYEKETVVLATDDDGAPLGRSCHWCTGGLRKRSSIRVPLPFRRNWKNTCNGRRRKQSRSLAVLVFRPRSPPPW